MPLSAKKFVPPSVEQPSPATADAVLSSQHHPIFGNKDSGQQGSRHSNIDAHALVTDGSRLARSVDLHRDNQALLASDENRELLSYWMDRTITGCIDLSRLRTSWESQGKSSKGLLDSIGAMVQAGWLDVCRTNHSTAAFWLTPLGKACYNKLLSADDLGDETTITQPIQMPVPAITEDVLPLTSDALSPTLSGVLGRVKYRNIKRPSSRNGARRATSHRAS